LKTGVGLFHCLAACRLLVVLLALPVITNAQHGYEHLHNQGPVPGEFLSYEKAGADAGWQSAPPQKKRDAKLFANFREESNYYTYRLLTSGYVLYNSPANTYINKVADRLFENDRTLRDNLRFYVVQSSAVNAFTFSNGMVFVNLGLLAHLENESDLAFILAHEAAHYVKKHSFNTYKTREKITRENKRNKDFDEEDYLFAINHFSREQELEADSIGFSILKRSAYSADEAVGAINMLKYADYPFENKAIRRTFFEGKYLKIPRHYFPDSATVITFDEYGADTLETHPSIGKRKDLINRLLVQGSNAGKIFVGKKEEFMAMRNNARYELSHLYLLERDYVNALYNTYLLLADSPDNVYLNACLIKSMYFIQLNANEKTLAGIVKSQRKIKGETQKIHFMLKKLRPDELNALCLRMAWDMHSKFPSADDISMFTQAITRNFASKVSNEVAYFAPPGEYNDSIIGLYYVNDTVPEQKKLYRGSKVYRKDVVLKGSFAKYVMAGYVNDQQFLAGFAEASSTVKTEVDEPNDEDQQAADKRQDARGSVSELPVGKKKKKEKNTSGRPDINNLIFVDVDRVRLDQRGSKAIMYVATDEKKREFLNLVGLCAGKNDVQINSLSPEIFSTNDTVRFSDREVLKFWLNERFANPGLPGALGVDQAELKDIAQRYDTRYVAFMSVMGLVKARDIDATGLCIGILYPPLLILELFEAFTPNTSSYINIAIYDVENGKMVYEIKNFYDGADRNDIIKADLYGFFYKIRRK
jgi:hypothetical protein